MAGVGEEIDNGSTLAGAAVPLILLNGHVCALSPEKPRNERNGVGTGFQLRKPYAWESDENATGFLMPRWMWSVVDGEVVRPSGSGESPAVPLLNACAGVHACRGSDQNLHEPTTLLSTRIARGRVLDLK